MFDWTVRLIVPLAYSEKVKFQHKNSANNQNYLKYSFFPSFSLNLFSPAFSEYELHVSR